MRIDLFARRAGSLAIDAVMVLPIAVILGLVSGYISESMMFRTEATTSVRTATAARASDAPCVAADRGAMQRDGVARRLSISCAMRDDEGGLGRERPLFEALRRAASGWPELVDEVTPKGRIDGVVGSGQGTVRMQEPPFLSRFDAHSTEAGHRMPTTERWDHGEQPWKAGYDPVIWRELSKRGTAQLFPRVFPQRNN